MSNRRISDWEIGRPNLCRNTEPFSLYTRRNNFVLRNRERPLVSPVGIARDSLFHEKYRFWRSRSIQSYELCEQVRCQEFHVLEEYGRNREPLEYNQNIEICKLPDRRINESLQYIRNRELFESQKYGNYRESPPEIHCRNEKAFVPIECNESQQVYEQCQTKGLEIYDPEDTFKTPSVEGLSPPPPLLSIELDTETATLRNKNATLLANLETIPEFDPGNAELTARDWVRIIDMIAQKKKWSCEERKYHMSQKLIGIGRQWYTATNSSECTWGDLKEKFIVAFPSDMDYYTLLIKMIDRKKTDDESYATYFTEKIRLIEKCGITGAKAVSCIIGGLCSSRLKEVAFRQSFKTPEALYEFICGDDGQDPEKEAINYEYFKCRIKPRKMALTTKIMFRALGKVQTANGFFRDVQVNGTNFRGFIDFNSAVCTIREDTACIVSLDYQKRYRLVVGFNGYNVPTVGLVRTRIAVELGTAIVNVYVCPDNIQAVPVIVGQNFLSSPDILVKEYNRNISIYQHIDNASSTNEIVSHNFPY